MRKFKCIKAYKEIGGKMWDAGTEAELHEGELIWGDNTCIGQLGSMYAGNWAEIIEPKIELKANFDDGVEFCLDGYSGKYRIVNGVLQANKCGLWGCSVLSTQSIIECEITLIQEPTEKEKLEQEMIELAEKQEHEAKVLAERQAAEMNKLADKIKEME